MTYDLSQFKYDMETSDYFPDPDRNYRPELRNSREFQLRIFGMKDSPEFPIGLSSKVDHDMTMSRLLVFSDAHRYPDKSC